MKRSRIGYNIHAQALKNHDRLLSHLTTIQPAAVVVLDGKGLAVEIKAACPDTMVIVREYGSKGDDDLHKQMSPEEFLRQRAHLSEGGKYWLYTTNEPGFDALIFAWHVRLMELVLAMPVSERPRLVLFNGGVGLPNGADPIGAWAEARRMLELIGNNPDWFVLGLHEYGGGVMTSGLIGGAPDHPAHPNYIWPENWPASIHNPRLTAFHCGRFKFLLDYCQRAGIKPPRIVLTEHGMDDLSDIKAWENTLKVTPPYLNIRGWKTLKDQWNGWYWNKLGWTPERAYFEQLKWADQAIYQGSVVEAQCVFSWGHSSDMWEQFDVADARELQTHLEQYAPVVTPPTPPVVTPPAPTYPAFPPDFPARAIAGYLSSSYAANIRKQPAVLSEIVGKLTDEPIAGWIIYPDQLKPDETVSDEQSGLKGVWVPVRIKQANTNLVDGWVFGALLTFKLAPPPKPDGREAAVRNALNQVSTMRAILDAQQKLLEEALEEV